MIEPDSLAAAALRAQAATHRLRQSDTLREAARRLIAKASRFDCHELVPATRAAEPLVTAAMLMSDGAVRMSDRALFGESRVMLVDAATITGDAARDCAQYLRDHGATWVAAVIYDRVRPDLDRLEAEPYVDVVAELSPITQAADA